MTACHEPACEITRAHRVDIDVLLQLVGEYYDFDDIDFDETEVRRGLNELLGDETLGGAWVLRQGAAPVGYFVLTYGFDLELGGRVALHVALSAPARVSRLVLVSSTAGIEDASERAFAKEMTAKYK